MAVPAGLIAALPAVLDTATKTGKAVSDVVRAQKEKKQIKENLAELQRLEALGLLGLTDEELRKLRDERLSPIQAQIRQERQQALADVSAQDVGGGAFFRARQGQEAAMARALDPGLRQIQRADEARRAQQRAEIQALEDALVGKRGDVFEAGAGLAGEAASTAAMISRYLQQAELDAEQEAAIYGETFSGDFNDYEQELYQSVVSSYE